MALHQRKKSLAASLLGFGLLLVVCLPPRVGEARDKLLAQSLALYQAGRFQASIATLNRALAQGGSSRLRARIYLYLGINYSVALWRSNKAVVAFAKALAIDPTVQINPSILREGKSKILGLFDRVRRRLRGTLKVVTTYGVGEVFVDGVRRGPTPYSGELTVGRYTVLVKAKVGSSSHQATVVIRPRQTATVTAELEPPSKLRVATLPRGATVVIGGRSRGRTPVEIGLEPGTYELVIDLSGHRTRTERVQLREGETSVAYELEPTAKVSLGDRVVDQSGVSTSPPTAPEVETPQGRRIWTWVVAGSAGAALVAGLVVGLSAESAWDDFQAAAEMGDRQSYAQLPETIRNRARIANVAYAAAGGLAIAAIVVYFLEKPRLASGEAATVRRRKSRVQAQLGPTGSSLQVSF